MDKDTLSRWEYIASNVCKLDDARETATKHRGLCSLQKTIHNEMGALLDACVAEAADSGIGKISKISFDCYSYSRFRDLLVNHLPEVKEWEADDDEMRAKRLEKLKRFGQTVSMWRVIDGKRVYEPDSIYCQNGLYRRFNEVCCTYQYKIVRALQVNKVRDNDLEIYYKAVCLYISLSNEKAAVEAVADALGVSLQDSPEPPRIATESATAQRRKTIHPEQETASAGKLERFMGCVPDKNKAKAKKLFQRLIKQGYCTANYEWIASKWKPRRSRLALACFCYQASNYLGLSEKVDAAGNPTTNWKPFEMLFKYDGKNQLMETKKAYMKTRTKFDPPEMSEIKALFPFF